MKVNEAQIDSLLQENIQISHSTNDKLDFYYKYGYQRITSFLDYWTNKVKWLKLMPSNPPGNKDIICFLYVPIYLRIEDFNNISEVHCGKILFGVNHAGIINYEFSIQQYDSFGGHRIQNYKAELIFDEKTSDNHELMEVLEKFIKYVNAWETIQINYELE